LVGIDAATTAAQLGISEYVAAVIANDDERRDGPAPPERKVSRRIANYNSGINATTIRRIQRMLEVGILPHVEIAREAGVSPNTVTDVAAGRRDAITMGRPKLAEGEQFLPRPIRCRHCRALISITPCRACSAQREKNSV
jgi:hypothetical protein